MAVVYDPDLGPVEVVDFPSRDTKGWTKADNYGPWLAYPEDGADHFHLVYMLRLGAKVRFVAHGRQHGPQHSSVMAATYWAFAHGWRDPFASAVENVHCIIEVRNGGAERLAAS